MKYKLESKSEDSEENIQISLQVNSGNDVLGSNTRSFLTFIALFIAIFQVYNKRSNRSKKASNKDGGGEQYLGIYDLPKVKNSVPLKLIGVAPQFWTPESTLKSAERVSNEYGELFHAEAFGLDVVVLNCGPALQTLLKSTYFAHLNKLPLLYVPMKNYIKNSILVSKGPFWQKYRRILMKSQSYQNLKAYIGMLNRHCKQFVNNLEKLFEDEKPHEINKLINIKFLEIISEIVTGKVFEKTDELKLYHKCFNVWKDTASRRTYNPLLCFKPIWFFHPMSRIYAKAEAELLNFAKRRIDEQREKLEVAKARPQVVDNSTSIENVIQGEPSFRSSIEELLDAGIDERQMIDEINVMMFGGHETGASTLHCLLFALALNQIVQEDARKEVDELFADSSNFYNGNITYAAIQSNLKYVERCIFEALRLFPPIFIQGRKLEKPLIIEYKDKNLLLPTGSNIIISPFITHRRKEYFPEPHKFDPDRFLPEEIAKRHPYSYIPFSAGTRNCPGMKFAMLELKIVTAYILRHFEMTTTDKFEETVFLSLTTLTPAKDFTFEFKRRSV